MKKTVYDFSEAVKEIEDDFTPRELADNLRATALRCAGRLNRDTHILQMQVAVQDVCAFLDAIVEREVEQ